MTPPATLSWTFPDVLSWSRPRPGRGKVRYTGAYAAGRDTWALLTRMAVLEAGWTPPPEARYRVTITVRGGGLRDLDRVCTAVLDACQAGGALKNDALVDRIRATRVPVTPGATASTDVTVELAPGTRSTT
jgi:hypothetical protein